MARSHPHAGKRVLVVEDEWLIASDLVAQLRASDYVVVGPAPQSQKLLGFWKTNILTEPFLTPI